MRTSNNGIELIKHFEGCELVPYLCSAGKRTIGVGHVILPGEKLESITEKQAMDLLARDLAKFETMVSGMVKVTLTQSQFDALVSFCFNLGPGNLKNSTLLAKLNAGDEASAATEFKRWINAAGKPLPGLLRRREAEAKLFKGESWK